MITVEMIQNLRKITGAGILDCKNALTEAGGNIDKAIEILREKGKTTTLKKSTKETKNGIIYSYIHPGSRIGVLLELNCETDFVARTEEFKNLAKEISMQIAALGPLWISKEDVPQDVIEKEKEIYKKQLLEEGKPEKILDKIIEGRLAKFYEQVVLMEQPYIRDTQGREKIKDLISNCISKTGENIKVKRFVRYCLGEE